MARKGCVRAWMRIELSRMCCCAHVSDAAACATSVLANLFDVEGMGCSKTGRFCVTPGCGAPLCDKTIDWGSKLPDEEFEPAIANHQKADLALCLVSTHSRSSSRKGKRQLHRSAEEQTDLNRLSVQFRWESTVFALRCVRSCERLWATGAISAAAFNLVPRVGATRSGCMDRGRVAPLCFAWPKGPDSF